MSLTQIDLSRELPDIKVYICKPDESMVGVLKNTTKPVTKNPLKTTSELTFNVPYQIEKGHQKIDNPIIPLIRSGYLLKTIYDDSIIHWFKIKRLTKEDDSEELFQVYAQSREIELDQKKLIDYSATSYTCTEVLTEILNGSSWNVGTIDFSLDTIRRDFSASKSVLDFILNDLVATYKAVAVFNTSDRTISLYPEDSIGGNKGLRVRDGQYLKSITEESNEEQLVTRLTCLGSEGISIERVNPTGKTYIDNFTNYIYPYEEDGSGNVIASSYYMSNSLAGALVDYNALVDSKSPTEQTAQSGTNSTTLILPNHGLSVGSYIVNRTRGREVRSVLSVPDSNTLTVAEVLNQTESDLIEKYNSSTFGYLLFQRDDINTDISTKTDELDALKLEKSQILDQLAIQSAAQTIDSYVGTLTNGTVTRTLSGLDTTYKMAALVKISTTTNTSATLNGSGVSFTADTWTTIGRFTGSSSYNIAITTTESSVSIQTLIVKITDTEYASATDSELIESYSADNKQSQIDSKQTEIDSLNTDLTNKNNEITTMSTSLSLEGNLTTQQLDELNSYIHEDIYKNDNLIDEYDVFNAGVEELNKRNAPQLLYKVNIVDFEQSITEQKNFGKLVLGDTITVYHERLGIDVQAKILEIERDFENVTVNLTIGNSIKILSDREKFFIEHYRSVHTTSQVNSNSHKWTNTNLNFDNRNDRLSTVPANPTIATDNTAIDHTQNDNGSVDISFEWSFPTYNPASPIEANNIDGFFVYYISSNNDNNITFGSTSTRKPVGRVPYTERSYAVYGVAANKYYTFGVQAYRIVDEDIDPSGMLTSDIVQPSSVTENPYRPMDNIALKGDLSGSIDGVSTSSIISQLNDLASDGKLTPTDKVIINKDWSLIQAEKTVVDTQADTYSITTEKTSYDNAYTALSTYITPLLTDLTTTSDIDATTFASKFSDYYSAKATLDKKISDTAKSLADSAQADATSALNELTDIASDSKLTPSDKQLVKKDWDAIVAEKPTIDLQADTYSITTEKTDYDTSYNTLNTYITPLLTDLTTTSDIVGATFRSNFSDYYSKRTTLLKKITDTAKSLADGAQSTANSASTAASNAQTSADTAQTDATNALNELSDISNDNKLTPNDKQIAKRDWDAIVSEKPTIDTAADSYGITTEKSDYDNAYNSLNSYITPLLSDLTTTSDITGSLFRSYFTSYYNKRTILEKKISDTAKSLADAAQAKADSSVQQDTFYNRVKTSTTGGIEIYDASNVQRLQIADLGSGKYGIRIKNGSGATTVETNSDGTLALTGGSVTVTHSDGSKSILNSSGLQVITEFTGGTTPYSYTLYNASGVQRYVKGQRVSSYYLSYKDTQQTGYISGVQTYAVAQLRGEAWFQLATQYNSVLADTGRLATDRQDELERMIIASLNVAFSDVNSSSPAYGLTFDWLNSQIDTSGIYVKEIIAVNSGDSVSTGGSTMTVNYRGAVMRAYAGITPSNTPIYAIMDVLGTMEV
jgi:phage minor structural protein